MALMPYFIILGLVEGADREISLNYSPLMTKTSGAQTKSSEHLDSKTQVKNVFGPLLK